jgi:hypothetical protein
MVRVALLGGLDEHCVFVHEHGHVVYVTICVLAILEQTVRHPEDVTRS